MFEILKTKLEIILAIFIMFQGHALYAKHQHLNHMKQEQAKKTAQILKEKNVKIDTSEGIPQDINDIDMNTVNLSKEQAIELINSIPDE